MAGRLCQSLLLMLRMVLVAQGLNTNTRYSIQGHSCDHRGWRRKAGETFAAKPLRKSSLLKSGVDIASGYGICCFERGWHSGHSCSALHGGVTIKPRRMQTGVISLHSYSGFIAVKNDTTIVDRYNYGKV